MDALRRPFFLMALAFIVLALLVELASPLAAGGTSALADARGAAAELGVDPGSVEQASEPPGRGIASMALLDGVVVFRLGLMGLALVVPARLLGRTQGCLTALLGLIALIVGIVLLLFLIIELIIMVTLFFSVPFGTLAYLAIWGFFPRGDAAALLSLTLMLKLGTAVFLVLAQQRFLLIKSLVLLIATTLIANLVLAFLHGFFPNPITSIADEIGAIIVVILGLIWVVLTLVGSIWGIVSVLRVDRAVAR